MVFSLVLQEFDKNMKILRFGAKILVWLSKILIIIIILKKPGKTSSESIRNYLEFLWKNHIVVS